jgi:hypothetical protein
LIAKGLPFERSKRAAKMGFEDKTKGVLETPLFDRVRKAGFEVLLTHQSHPTACPSAEQCA